MAFLKSFQSLSSILGACLFLLLSSTTPTIAVEFTLYEDKYLACHSWGGGTCETFQVSERGCINFNFYSNKVSSINTHGGCVKLWDGRNCQGASIKLQPGSPNCVHSDLSRCSLGLRSNWDNELSSVSGCQFDEPEPTTTARSVPLRTSSTVNCPTGSWVQDIKVMPGYTYGLELYCYEPGSKVRTIKLAAKGQGESVGRKVHSYCTNKPMRGVAFYREHSNPKTEVRGFCDIDDQWRYSQGSSLCANPGHAVCGIKLETTGKDITDGEVICCEVPNPAKTCTPTDRYEVIKDCDNVGGSTPMDCSYRKAVGISKTKSLSSGNSESADYYSSIYSGISSSKGSHSSTHSGSSSNVGANVGVGYGPVSAGVNVGHTSSNDKASGITSELSSNFGNNLGKSSNTGYDWSSSSTSSWNEEVDHTVAYTVPPGVRTRLEQVVGTCGFLQVRTNQVRRQDFDGAGNRYSPSNSFRLTTTVATPAAEGPFSIRDYRLYQMFLRWLETQRQQQDDEYEVTKLND